MTITTIQMMPIPSYSADVPEFATQIQHGINQHYLFAVTDILNYLLPYIENRIRIIESSSTPEQISQRQVITFIVTQTSIRLQARDFQEPVKSEMILRLLLNELPLQGESDLESHDFLVAIKSGLYQWYNACFLNLMKANIFSSEFHYQPEDFQRAGYTFKPLKHHIHDTVHNGTCIDFVFSQMCEADLYDALFGKRAGYTSSNTGTPLLDLGYVPVASNKAATGDVIVYGHQQNPNCFPILHYGIYYNKRVLSKQGALEPIYSHPIEKIHPDYGNCYYVLRKVCIPSLQKAMKAHLAEASELKPLTTKGILARFEAALSQDLNQRVENVLPTSQLTNVGKRFLVKYRSVSESEFQKSRLTIDESATKTFAIDELSNMVDRMKLSL